MLIKALIFCLWTFILLIANTTSFLKKYGPNVCNRFILKQTMCRVDIGLVYLFALYVSCGISNKNLLQTIMSSACSRFSHDVESINNILLGLSLFGASLNSYLLPIMCIWEILLTIFTWLKSWRHSDVHTCVNNQAIILSITVTS